MLSRVSVTKKSRSPEQLLFSLMIMCPFVLESNLKSISSNHIDTQSMFSLNQFSLCFIPPPSHIPFICCCLVSQSCLTLCDPMDYSPPGFSVHGISQARILEWVAISFSRRPYPPWDQSQDSSTSR